MSNRVLDTYESRHLELAYQELVSHERRAYAVWQNALHNQDLVIAATLEKFRVWRDLEQRVRYYPASAQRVS